VRIALQFGIAKSIVHCEIILQGRESIVLS
jgi:hypothetical protein